MLQSHLFIPTRQQPPSDEPSKNGRLLAQAGFIDRLHAGAYSWLPLGLRVLNRVAQVVREEHAAIGAQEVLMPALQVPGVWEETGRWHTLGKEVMYQWKDQSGHPFGLATTHEEVIVDLVRRGVQSYRDLPQALYQIQWKFRNEARAKSGVIRGREFLMKDLYSFNIDAEAHAAYYQKVQEAYKRIFSRFGLNALVTEASGGSFTKQHSHEFQVVSEAGEDRILTCTACGYAQNVELGESTQCPSCKAEAKIVKAIEVGNTFNFGNAYGSSMKLTAVDAKGKAQPLYVASYGIGISRLVGTLAEVFADAKGLVWPVAAAPFAAHVIILGSGTVGTANALELEKQSVAKGREILVDNRDVSAGFKLKDADLLGMPWRIVCSERHGNNVELTERRTGETKIVSMHDALTAIHTV